MADASALFLQQIPPDSPTHVAIWGRWSDHGVPDLSCASALSSVGDAFLWAESRVRALTS